MGYSQALEQYIAATNTHQFKNVKKLLHPEAMYWFTDQICTTMGDIQRYFEQAWQTIREEVYRATEVKWIAVDKRVATCTYIYEWEGWHEGTYKRGSGRATNVFQKTDGEWKLVHEHLSSMP